MLLNQHRRPVPNIQPEARSLRQLSQYFVLFGGENRMQGANLAPCLARCVPVPMVKVKDYDAVIRPESKLIVDVI